MIKIISGTVRTSLGLKTSKDKPFSLPPKEEQRFIDRKVAARVYQEEVLEPVATPSADPAGEGVGVTSSTEELGAEGEETVGNLDADQLKKMKLDDLKQLAKDMDIDTNGLRTKDDYVAAIAAVDVILGPELSAEEIVE